MMAAPLYDEDPDEAERLLDQHVYDAKLYAAVVLANLLGVMSGHLTLLWLLYLVGWTSVLVHTVNRAIDQRDAFRGGSR